jgi:hypothetical protein
MAGRDSLGWEAAEAARSWAEGGTGTREGEDVNNAKYYSVVAQSYAGMPVLSPTMPVGQPVGGLWFDNSGGSPLGGNGDIIIMTNVHYGDDTPGEDYGAWIDPDDEV